jgi:hypothetical protein
MPLTPSPPFPRLRTCPFPPRSDLLHSLLTALRCTQALYCLLLRLFTLRLRLHLRAPFRRSPQSRRLPRTLDQWGDEASPCCPAQRRSIRWRDRSVGTRLWSSPRFVLCLSSHTLRSASLLDPRLTGGFDVRTTLSANCSIVRGIFIEIFLTTIASFPLSLLFLHK